MDVKIDYIFFASSSGGTQAGLVLGLELYGFKYPEYNKFS